MTKPNLTRLQRILEWARPAETPSEKEFVESFLVPLLKSTNVPVVQDDYGNVIVQVGSNDPVSMFSSHTDTVHTNGGRQKLAYDSTLHHIFVDKKEARNCLGADDGTGIWLMLHMIENKVPGLYVFHRDEEIGGCGSRALAAKKDLFKNIRICVAFDRKGYTDIITHQGGRRTASDEFAAALAKYLPGFTASNGGTFTDSKNYCDMIPECTNLSVGYFDQHTSREYQDVKFAVKLANSLVQVPWDTLPAVRDPSVVETTPKKKDWSYGGYTGALPGSQTDWLNFDTAPQNRAFHKRYNYPTRAELASWIKSHPISAAHLLFDLGVTKDDLLDAESYTQERARESDKTLEFQRSANVREMPAGGKKAVSGQTPPPGKSASGSRKSGPPRH